MEASRKRKRRGKGEIITPTRVSYDTDYILNHNCLETCFIGLSVQDLANSRLVCRLWKKVVDKNVKSLWEPAYVAYTDRLVVEQNIPHEKRAKHRLFYSELLTGKPLDWKSVYSSYILLSRLFKIVRDKYPQAEKWYHTGYPYLIHLLPIFSARHYLGEYFLGTEPRSRHLQEKMLILFEIIKTVSTNTGMEAKWTNMGKEWNIMEEWIIVGEKGRDFPHIFFLGVCFLLNGEDVTIFTHDSQASKEREDGFLLALMSQDYDVDTATSIPCPCSPEYEEVPSTLIFCHDVDTMMKRSPFIRMVPTRLDETAIDINDILTGVEIKTSHVLIEYTDTTKDFCINPCEASVLQDTDSRVIVVDGERVKIDCTEESAALIKSTLDRYGFVSRNWITKCLGGTVKFI